MSDPTPIVRIAARGDGASEDGRFYCGAVPGDQIAADGQIIFGPHHADPLCQHFGACGGCQLQHGDDSVLAEFVRSRVVDAAKGQGLAIGELLETHLSPVRARRRATLHAIRTKKRVLVGFRRSGSHSIVDLDQCEVIRPQLFAAIAPVRDFLGRHAGKGAIDIDLTLADQGVDCTISNLHIEGFEASEALLDLARSAGFARLALDQGYGPETMWEPDPLTITLGGIAVPMPQGAFLQATRDAEAAMVGDARNWLGEAGALADLFSGLGTFALALAPSSRVLAVEASRDAHLALTQAARAGQLPLQTLHRDLFRNPLREEELERFDAVLLDPPRAGARAQIARIAASKLDRVVYVSCNPSSWARDAKNLIDAGFRLEKLRPIGQFRWSTHVELTSLFTR